MPRPPLAAPALIILVAILLVAPALGAPQPQGRWDNLGEDGRIWVPFDAPATTALPPPSLGDYHNTTEAVATLQALALARPDLMSLQTLGTSVQGRPLVLATITAPGDASARTRVLFDGAHHGDEVIGSEILVRFAQRIIAEYDTNATMRAALADVVIDIVPMVNPDGIDHVPQCSYYADCRKNARGVDLNRNYRAHWGEPGSSGDPGSATYRGPAPTSEPETQVITALLDENAYAIYASLHSGAEMILWPWGWTTTPPPEQSVYQQLGDELTAITGAPHGQVSRILYGVSGDSMDQAYGAASGWRAIAVSPETYKGSGGAFDWWLLFNPPESDAAIAPVVARWDRFLWHLVEKAPLYAPATLSVPPSMELGPDAGDLSFVVTAPPRRPLLDAAVRFDAASAAADVLSANPVALGDASGTQSGMFRLLPLRGGTFDATVTLDAGPGGLVTRPLTLDLVQVGMTLALDAAEMESPDANVARVTVDAGPFAHVAGNVVVTLGDAVLGAAPFTATPGAPATLAIAFDGAALPGGEHEIVARAVFNATDADDVVRAGQLQSAASLLVKRPQVSVDKRFAPAAAVGSPVLITSVFRNVGTMTATGVVVHETVPPGYLYYTRDGPFPLPPDPLGRPAPTSVAVRADGGGLDLTWNFGSMAPGAVKFAQYRMMPVMPGTHALPSAWTYTGAFASGAVQYDESAMPTHTTTIP